jgi:hypothetical protein
MVNDVLHGEQRVDASARRGGIVALQAHPRGPLRAKAILSRAFTAASIVRIL